MPMKQSTLPQNPRPPEISQWSASAASSRKTSVPANSSISAPTKSISFTCRRVRRICVSM
jgi:hypothetical protein